MIMVTLQSAAGDKVRVPKADDYPGYQGWTVLVEEEWPTLAMLRDDAWEQVKEIRSAKEADVATTPIGVVQIDEKSKLNITGALSLCRLQEELGQPFALNFTLADNSRVTLDGTTVRQLAGAVGEFVSALYDHAADLRDALEAAADVAALQAIDIEGGWPT